MIITTSTVVIAISWLGLRPLITVLVWELRSGSTFNEYAYQIKFYDVAQKHTAVLHQDSMSTSMLTQKNSTVSVDDVFCCTRIDVQQLVLKSIKYSNNKVHQNLLQTCESNNSTVQIQVKNAMISDADYKNKHCRHKFSILHSSQC